MSVQKKKKPNPSIIILPKLDVTNPSSRLKKILPVLHVTIAVPQYKVDLKIK
jgi:hypothetical protein